MNITSSASENIISIPLSEHEIKSQEISKSEQKLVSQANAIIEIKGDIHNAVVKAKEHKEEEDEEDVDEYIKKLEEAV